ncbi:MAG: hypothetical protein ACI89X_001299 [Planctomycetota bacterium]|jgi:hypothetical protein
MHMPPPNEHHERLAQAFAGTWKGTETMHPSDWDPKGSKAPATTAWRRDLGNYALIVDYEIHNEGHPNYRGHGVYTVEPGLERHRRALVRQHRRPTRDLPRQLGR